MKTKQSTKNSKNYQSPIGLWPWLTPVNKGLLYTRFMISKIAVDHLNAFNVLER